MTFTLQITESGTLLHIPEGLEVAEPIFLKASGHLTIRCENGSKATIVQELGSLEGAAVAAVQTVYEIIAESGSHIQFIDLQNLDTQTDEIALKRAEIAREATLEWFFNLAGSRTSKTNLEILFKGEGSHADVSGLICSNGKQKLEIDSLLDHVAPNTSSNLLIKSTADGESKTIFHGMIRIAKPAQKTDAYMANHNLILSDKAHADSQPKLEIEASRPRTAPVSGRWTVNRFFISRRGA